MDDYKLFFGIVEDIYDPEKNGRVRVRIHSIHSPYNDVLSTDNLPWCKVFSPASMSAGISGIGHSNVSLLQGSLVAGCFLDGDFEQFFVLWSIDGHPKEHTGESKGNVMFKDPDGIFPLEYNVPDFNCLTDKTRDIKESPIYERDKNQNIIQKIATGKKNEVWKEPTSRHDSEYPWNKVYQTVSNHLIEYEID